MQLDSTLIFYIQLPTVYNNNTTGERMCEMETRLALLNTEAYAL